MRLKINWSVKTPLHRVLSILPNQPVRNQWNYQEKMERHFSVEIEFSIESSDPFTFLPKVWLLVSNVGLETRIFGNGTESFGRTGPTGQRGPPVEVDHFDRNVSTRIEPFQLRLNGNFRKFWHNGSTYSLRTGVSRFGFKQHLDFIVTVVGKKKWRYLLVAWRFTSTGWASRIYLSQGLCDSFHYIYYRDRSSEDR